MKKSSESGDGDARPGSLGARRDDSSLFSVAALTKQTQEKVPEPAPKAKEDSGIIDIRALALGRKAGASAPSDPPAAMPHADVFNRGAVPVLAPPVLARPATVPPKASGSKTPLVIGALVVVAVGAAAATFLAMRGPTEAAAVASAAPPRSAAAPVPEKAPTPEVTAPAVEAAIPGQLSRKEPPPKASGTLVAKAGGAVPAKAPTAKATAEAAPEPPPPPVDTCDLQCQMQRAVEKKH